MHVAVYAAVYVAVYVAVCVAVCVAVRVAVCVAKCVPRCVLRCVLLHLTSKCLWQYMVVCVKRWCVAVCCAATSRTLRQCYNNELHSVSNSVI